MSHDATRWAWTTSAEHGARLVLLALADAHNGLTSLCCPSVARLAQMTRLERKAVMRAIRDLEAAGLVLTERREGRFSCYLLRMGDQSQNGTGTKMGPVPKEDSTSPKMGHDPSQNGTRNQEGTRKEPGNPLGEGMKHARNGTAQEPFLLPLAIPTLRANENALAPPSRSKARPTRKRAELLDALLLATGTADPTKATPQEIKSAAAAMAGIRTASPSVTPEELARRASNYREAWPNILISPQALAKHWSKFENGDPRREAARLREAIERHPANTGSVYHDPNATAEMKADLAEKRRQLLALTSREATRE